MTTTAYKNIRALCQLISVLLIVINIPLPFILLLNVDFINIEQDILKMGRSSITSLYKIMIISNITLGMFASCCVNSKIKIYMKFYLVFAMIYLIINASLILFVKKRYFYSLNNMFITKSNDLISFRFILENALCCSMADDSCRSALIIYSAPLIKYFLLVSCASFVLHILHFVFIKIAVKMSIEKPQAKIPKFVNVTRAGMDTVSLRQKRIIQVDENLMKNKSITVGEDMNNSENFSVSITNK